MKKIIALFLVLCLSVSLLAACSSKEAAKTNPPATSGNEDDANVNTSTNEPDTSKHVVLTMYCIGDEGGIYAQEHLDKLNAVLTEKINAEIKPIMTSWGDYKTKLPMVWASGEAYDLTYTANWISYYDEASKGAFMDISELFPKYAPQTYAEAEELDMLETTKVDGKLYMVPAYKEDYTTFLFCFREDLRKKYDCPEIDSWEDLMTYMQAIVDNEPGMLPMGCTAGDQSQFQYVQGEWDWARPIDNSAYGVLTYDLKNPTAIFNLVDTPEYEAFINRCRECYQAGYWSQSVMAETLTPKDAFLSGKSAVYAANFSNANTVYNELKNNQPDWEVGFWSSDLASGTTESIAPSNNGMSIGAFSENPERAMMFLELVYQDEEVYHLVADGLEGITFEADYENRTKWVPESVDPSTINLKNIAMGFGSKKFALSSKNDAPALVEMRNEYGKVQVVPALAGFVLNRDSISAELAAIKSVCEEYKVPLERGIVDPAEGLATLREKLEKAGIDKVLEEVNRQLNEYLANQ